ncbi:MAG: hypothetical protein B6245_09235 [Desulfobacteraceae bacterium 4572_88]|nr:MAG: hypothetical protein B6245_09235 [Desulfobacteraceae bacterium 4572_88]
MHFVSDTSPLIALSKIGHLQILEKLFLRVLIPRSVSEEFLRNCTPEEEAAFEDACQNFLRIIEITKCYRFKRRLDTWERDALTLAMEKKAAIIIDDRKGFNEAVEQNLIAVSTMRIAEERNIIPDYKELEKSLRKKSFFLPAY